MSVKLPKDAEGDLLRYKARLIREKGERVSDGQAVAEALRGQLKAGSAEKGSWEEVKKVVGILKISDRQADGRVRRIREDRDKWRLS